MTRGGRPLRTRIVVTTALVSALAMAAMVSTVVLALNAITHKSVDTSLSDQLSVISVGDRELGHRPGGGARDTGRLDRRHHLALRPGRRDAARAGGQATHAGSRRRARAGGQPHARRTQRACLPGGPGGDRRAHARHRGAGGLAQPGALRGDPHPDHRRSRPARAARHGRGHGDRCLDGGSHPQAGRGHGRPGRRLERTSPRRPLRRPGHRPTSSPTWHARSTSCWTGSPVPCAASSCSPPSSRTSCVPR